MYKHWHVHTHNVYIVYKTTNTCVELHPLSTVRYTGTCLQQSLLVPEVAAVRGAWSVSIHRYTGTCLQQSLLVPEVAAVRGGLYLYTGTQVELYTVDSFGTSNWLL